MPERIELGKKAIEYLNRKTDVESAQRILEQVKSELIELFQAEGRTSIKVEGFTVTFKHSERDSIAVRQSKRRNAKEGQEKAKVP
jgi:hypothetical protein